MNPISGVIQALSIGELIMDETKINPSQTQIITSQPMVKIQPKECICS